MMIDSVSTLVDALRCERLLDEPQLAQLSPEVLDGHSTPESLGEELVRAGWVTPYQIRHLIEERPTRLIVGPYCIVDRLGEGGVSEVYKAHDPRTNLHVALKVMRQDLVSQEDAIRQFEREHQAVTRLSHPNIIKTYEAGQAGTAHWFAMEFVAGTDLGKVVQLSGSLPVAEACDYIRQVATALQYAHTMGLVHRDVKPANLYLVHPPGHDAPLPGVTWKRPADPVIKIIDWGLARLQELLGEGGPSVPCSVNREEGMLVGTADYIAPEQARDPRLVDIRADIYSLGCTLYFLLAGQPPFPGTSLMQKLLQHQETEPTPIRTLRPDVPEELAVILQKMLMKQPEGRYQIPLAVAVPLRRFCEGNGSNSQPVSKRPGGSGHGMTLRPSGEEASDKHKITGLLRRGS